MTTTQVIDVGGEQHIRVPDEFKLKAGEISIRREGDALILEPVTAARGQWPPGFFESIRIDDPAFERPTQGAMPAVPHFDE